MSGSSTAAEHPPGLPSGTIRRLTTHYGPRVATWLRSAPDLVFRIATRYDLSFQGFHDAGWTSVVATATTRVDEQLVIIKAVPDARRFAREATVLTHWRGNGSCRLLHADRTDRVLLLPAVGQVGGTRLPADHQARAAAVIPLLHARPAAAHPDVSELACSFRQRIAARLMASPHLNRLCEPDALRNLIRMGHAVLDRAEAAVMLHADLYRENLLFDTDGAPAWIDPRGRRGPAEYDWAFWAVLYDRGGFTVRLKIATDVGEVDRQALLTWVAITAADGLHYHLEVDDRSAAQEMLAILTSTVVQHAVGRHA